MGTANSRLTFNGLELCHSNTVIIMIAVCNVGLEIIQLYLHVIHTLAIKRELQTVHVYAPSIHTSILNLV